MLFQKDEAGVTEMQEWLTMEERTHYSFGIVIERDKLRNYKQRWGALDNKYGKKVGEIKLIKIEENLNDGYYLWYFIIRMKRYWIMDGKKRTQEGMK